MYIAATYDNCGLYLLRDKLLYTKAVLLSSLLFVNKVLTLFTCDNGSAKGTGVNKSVNKV